MKRQNHRDLTHCSVSMFQELWPSCQNFSTFVRGAMSSQLRGVDQCFQVVCDESEISTVAQ